MGFNLGNTNIGSLYVGSTKIGSAYLGSTKVYESIPPGPTFDKVTIGTQTWMAKNLAIDDGQGGIYTRTVNYGLGDVVEYYYTWDAAVRVAANIDGWHLPTELEWITLINTIGGKSTSSPKLKSTFGWSNNGNGTDDYGFTGLPAGYSASNGLFYNLGTDVYFWTATQTSETYANTRRLRNTSVMIYDPNQSKTYRYSVRLVKDA